MPKIKINLRNQAGFAHTMLIVSLLVIVGVSAVGYRVFVKSHADTLVSNGVISDSSGFLFQPDGSGMSQVMPNQGSALAWSPDGNRIAFENSAVAGGPDNTLYIGSPAGAKGSAIYTAQSDFQSDPQWSPDGQWLLVDDGGSYKIVHPDGTGVQQVNAGIHTALTWGADSASFYAIKNDAGPHSLCTLSITGSEESCGFDPCQTFITYLGGSGSCVRQLRLSHDGTRLAYIMVDPTLSSPVGQLFTSNLDGSSPVQVISSKGGVNSYSVAWAPDGTQLAVGLFSTADKGSGTYIVNSDSTNLHRAFWNGGGPSWQPVTAATTFKFVLAATCNISNVGTSVATGISIAPNVTLTNTGSVPINIGNSTNLTLEIAGKGSTTLSSFSIIAGAIPVGGSAVQTTTAYKVVSMFPTNATLSYMQYLGYVNYQTDVSAQTLPVRCGKTFNITVPTIANVQVNPSDWQKLKSASIVTDSPKGNVVRLSNASGNEMDTSTYPNSSITPGVLPKLDKFLEANAGHQVKLCAVMRAGSSSTVKIDVMHASTTTNGITKSVSYSLGNSYSTKCFNFTIGLIGAKTYAPGFGNVRMSVTGGSAAFIDAVTLTLVS